MNETDSSWWYNHLRHTTAEKYDNKGKGWYFRFDDYKMSYKYILLITWTLMGQFNTYNPTCCEENKEDNWGN